MNLTAYDQSMLVTKLAGDAPFLIVLLAGAVLCMVRDARPVRARAAVGVALALHAANRFVLPLIYIHLRRQFALGGGNFLLELVHSSMPVVSASALALLLYAAFTNDDRSPKSSDVAS